VATARHDVAERIRVLLGSSSLSGIEAAQRLSVDPVQLQASVDQLAPSPTVEVLTAVVAYYGVDPTYLLTGEYSAETHGIALEGGREGARLVLNRLMSQLSPIPAAAWSEALQSVLRLDASGGDTSR
jgi:hypothetical protein